MAGSEAYKDKFLYNFDNIKEYGVDKFLYNMGADKIIKEPDMLALVTNYAYNCTESVLNKNKMPSKKLILKR